MILNCRLAAAASLAAVFLFVHPAASADGPVVVELFTSQGCNSCPPADRVLGELADRPDVLPLSFHVTYWDRLGWPDTLGLEAATERQRGYARAMDSRRVYTPQAVIGGRIELVGSRRGKVHEIIEILQDRRPPAPSLIVDGDRIRIGAGEGAATVWLISFEERRTVAIERGENAGRTITYHNVVSDIRPLAEWVGAPIDLTLPAPGSEASERALLLQTKGLGPILAAARLDASS
jgi:hypothetical protein